MDDHSNLFINRSQLAQTLFVLSSRQLKRFRDQFPTPIPDHQIETALELAKGYPNKDPDPRPVNTSPILPQTQRKANKKMKIK